MHRQASQERGLRSEIFSMVLDTALRLPCPNDFGRAGLRVTVMLSGVEAWGLKLDAGYWILDTGYWILDTGYWILDTGYWLLDIGYWILLKHTNPLL